MLASERSVSRCARISARAVSLVETEALAEPDAFLQGVALGVRLARDAAQMRGLVGEHRDRERRVVAGADLVLKGDPVQRAADRGLEVRELPRDEGDTRRVRADAREGVAVVAPHDDRMPRDARRFGREQPLRAGAVGRAHGRPTGVAVDAVGIGEESDPDHEPEDQRQPRAARRPRGRGNEDRLALLVDGLDPAEVGIVRAGKPALGRTRLRSVAPLADPARDELELHRREDHERKPERDLCLEPIGEQPGGDEGESTDASCGLDPLPRKGVRHPARVEGA